MATTMDVDKDAMVFEKERLSKYFKMCLTNLSHHYTGLDTSRLTIVYFATLGLDIINDPLEGKYREDVIDYIYSLQVSFLDAPNRPNKCQECDLTKQSGFLGSSFLGVAFNREGYDLAALSSCMAGATTTKCFCAEAPALSSYIQGHIAMTYCSVLTLQSLGDDFSRLNRASILSGLKQLQQPSGAFQATRERSECDMRFLYCACAISATLNDWTGVDICLAEQYVIDCITYEGGISLIPGNEAHGGSTYTAVASLVLMNRLHALSLEHRANLIRWCLMRQNQNQCPGYNGRTNKDNDSCYSFWIGATLHLLGVFGLTHVASTREFLLQQCQHRLLGGFAKFPGAPPDILHTYYSLCWLSMAEEPGTALIDCRLGLRADKTAGVISNNSSPGDAVA